MTLVSPKCFSDSFLVFHSHRIFILASTGSKDKRVPFGPDDLNHCYESPCVCESIWPSQPAPGLRGAKQLASVNTLCVCILRLLCGEFHISQVTASAACSNSRDQGHPAGSGNNAEPNLAEVLPQSDTNKNKSQWKEGEAMKLLLLLPYVTQLFFFFLENKYLWANCHPPPPLPSPTFSDSVRLDYAAGAVGCTEGCVGGTGAHRGRKEIFQLLDKQQGGKNNRLNTNTSSSSSTDFFILGSFADFLGLPSPCNQKCWGEAHTHWDVYVLHVHICEAHLRSNHARPHAALPSSPSPPQLASPNRVQQSGHLLWQSGRAHSAAPPSGLWPHL